MKQITKEEYLALKETDLPDSYYARVTTNGKHYLTIDKRSEKLLDKIKGGVKYGK